MPEFFLYVLIGFLAQLVDGTAGMAYGLSCRTFLKAFTGLPAGLISAVVHWAEAPVSLISGIAHFSLGNVNRPLLLRLLLPGILGGLCGVCLVVYIDSAFERLISFYLLLMGGLILWRALRPARSRSMMHKTALIPLALLGGFLDAAGGGGWGQIVGGTLLASGNDAKKTIGSVNVAEAFVTLVEAVAFFAMIGEMKSYFLIIGGLITGGILSAPFAAWCCTKVPTRPLLAAVGALIILGNIPALG